MSTVAIRSSVLTLLFSFAVACGPPPAACPAGFALSAAGRCVGSDAGLPVGDSGPTLGDAGLDAATLGDAGPMIDSGTLPVADGGMATADAGTPAVDAAVAMPDAYLAPDACAYGTWYADTDGDGFGDHAAPRSGCAQPAGTVVDATDCDDTHASSHPGATEVCNGVDDNCVGGIDEGTFPTFFYDQDNDLHGDPSMPVSTYCTAPPHYVSVGDDCDDHDATSHPGATEVCDHRDNNCAGGIDEGVLLTFYVDADGDTYGGTSTMSACSAPTGYVARAGDCADTNASAHPGATETCDFVDQNCDGVVDNGLQIPYWADCDGDHFAPTGASMVLGCPGVLPTSAPPCSPSSPRTWTPTAPTTLATTDCTDIQPLAFPGSTHWDTAPAIGTYPSGSWDWNCDGTSSMYWPSTTGTLMCSPPPPLQPACRASGEHWLGTVPPCGASGNLYTCGPSPACGQNIDTVPRNQLCR